MAEATATESAGREGRTDESGLAPEPNFRRVTLAARTRPRDLGPLAMAALGAGTVIGAATLAGWRHAAVAALVYGAGAAVALRRGTRERRKAAPGRAVSMAIVPWGIIIDEGGETRILRWGAIARVEVETLYGRDQATDLARGSTIVVETDHERLVGKAPHEVPLERLVVHRDAYAREAAHVAAVDLDGRCAAGESWEPQFERLLETSHQMLRGGSDSLTASLIGYRGLRSRLVSEEVATRLRAILTDRTDRALDPRPLSAILAAELGLTSLAPEIAQLVSSPHPLTAATARVAGMALGIPKSRLGVLDEVAPFLPDADVEALSAWTTKAD